MNESIFREKSLQKVKSPDNLNEYIRVANPGVWVLLAAVIALLVGMCIWGIFGQLTTEIMANARSDGGIVTCYLPEKGSQSVRPGMPATIDGHPGTVSEVSVRSNADSTCIIEMKEPLPDGIYIAQIEVENIHPSFFLLKRGTENE